MAGLNVVRLMVRNLLQLHRLRSSETSRLCGGRCRSERGLDFETTCEPYVGAPVSIRADVDAGCPLPAPPQPGTRAIAAPLDRDGFPQLPAGRPGSQGRGANGVTRETYRMAIAGECVVPFPPTVFFTTRMDPVTGMPHRALPCPGCWKA
jgi:hypothetical protein